MATTAPIAVTIIAMTLVFGMQVGPLSLLGSMTAVWGRNRPLRSGLVIMGSWTLGITASLAIGVLSAPVAHLALPLTIVVALIGVWTYNLRPSNGPGPLNLFFACALGTYLGTLGSIGWWAVLVTFLSGALTTVLCQLHLVRDPDGPLRRSVLGAQAACKDYLGENSGSIARWEAHRAVHRAVDCWQQGNRRAKRKTAMRLRATLSRVAGQLHAAESRRLGFPAALDAHGSLSDPAPVRLAYLIRRQCAMRTFGQLTALRVAAGLVLAGLLTTLFGTEHFYWSVLTAGVILHVGPNRVASVERAVHRSLGTFAGVGIVVLLGYLDLSAPWQLAVVVLGAFGMNLFLAHHYALSIMCVTPMSLMVTNVMAPDMLDGVLVHDRLIETLIGAASAIIATLLFSAHGLRAIVQDQLRWTALAIRALLEAAGGNRDARREYAHLVFELDATGLVARRASQEAAGLWNLAEREAQLVDLGYDVLAGTRSGSSGLDGFGERLAAFVGTERA